MAFGRIKVDQIESSTKTINVDDIGLSSGVSDGNKGDITVASGGTVWTVNNGAVSYNELANLPSFTGPIVAGRESGTGALQGLTLGTGLSISGGVLSATVSGGTGGVTSVGLVAPSGFAVTGSPVTSSGNITLSFAAGYSLPTTTSQANWDTAYLERLRWDGGASGINAVTGRTSLGLGNSATLDVGTTAGTVAAGNALSVHVAAADPHPNYALESSLATVATTGAYNDLTGKPAIPVAADALPQNLGTASIGISTDYAREDHAHAMPSAGDVGADPVGTSASGISAHEAAADPHPGYALETSLAIVATTGSYADLSNTPTFTGPIVAGRASGTGALAGLTLGAGLSIVDSQLTVSSSGTGTVTSVGLVVPSGFAVNNSPITSAGDITVVFASGYSLPTTASQANWDTAYSERLYWDGGATGLNATSGRTSLGLGNSATLNIGATAGTVAAGDDSRFTTNLSYTPSSRLLESSTGSDVTLPLFTSTTAGLAPLSGGGTTNFLRADGTWAAPAGGGGGTIINPGYTPGNLIAPPTYRDGSVSSSPVVGLPSLSCIYIPVATTFSQIIIRTWSNYSGTSTIQLGIYDHSAASAGPNNLIYGSGNLEFTGTINANYGPSGFSVTLQPGFYWLAFLAISNAATPNFWGPASNSPGLGYPWHVEFAATGTPTTIGRTNFGGLTALPANLIGNFRTDSFTRPIPMLVV